MKSNPRRYSQDALSPHQIQTRNYHQLNLEQAHELLPVISKLTEQAALELQPLKECLNNRVPADPRNHEVQQSYKEVVRIWTGKIERLGLKVLGLWLVGFDCGEGWYAWQYPERRIRYFLEYGQVFSEAKLIHQLNLDTVNSVVESK